MAEKLTMTAQELADTLGINVLTLYDRRSKQPDTIPKPLNIPGQKTLLWLSEDVKHWLIQFRADPIPEPARRGRPPKLRAAY